MNDLITFDLGELGKLRARMDSTGEPWFCAKDILEGLNYNDLNSRISNICAYIPEKWKAKVQFPSLRGPRLMLTVNEPGLHYLVSHSTKPKVLPFQKKIAEKVIPSIRKAGPFQSPP